MTPKLRNGFRLKIKSRTLSVEWKSKDEIKNVNLKISVHISERSKVMPQGTIQPHKRPFRDEWWVSQSLCMK